MQDNHLFKFISNAKVTIFANHKTENFFLNRMGDGKSQSALLLGNPFMHGFTMKNPARQSQFLLQIKWFVRVIPDCCRFVTEVKPVY